jgi:hypothetical protein
VIKVETLKVSPAIGEMSLIGVRGRPPHPFGNYFSLRHEGLRVLNFWAENLKGATAFLPDGQLQIRVWSWEEHPGCRPGKVCIIDDPRIPADWYYNKLCFTGFGVPPIEIARQIYAHLGDPYNEFERFTDSEMYWARKGRRSRGRSIISTPGDTPDRLVAELTARRAKEGSLT